MLTADRPVQMMADPEAKKVMAMNSGYFEGLVNRMLTGTMPAGAGHCAGSRPYTYAGLRADVTATRGDSNANLRRQLESIKADMHPLGFGR